ncbi:MAG: ferric iron reductase [Ilumatobacteraceae bacterium]
MTDDTTGDTTGDTAGDTAGGLTGTVARIQARVSYLRCAAGMAPDEGWIPCADLIADPERLRREIDATAAGRGADDPQVAASLYAQAYAFRVPSIAIAAYALGLPGPTTAPTSTAIRIARNRPAELAVLDPVCREPGASALAAELFDDHLAPFVAAVLAGTRVGERLLWGNVAASIATIFRAVQSSGPLGDPDVRARAEEFEVASRRWLGGLGGYSTLEVPGALGWYWTRTSCCLWYRASDGSYCGDCSLHEPAELAEKRLADLTGSSAS